MDVRSYENARIFDIVRNALIDNGYEITYDKLVVEGGCIDFKSKDTEEHFQLDFSVDEEAIHGHD